MANNPTLLKMPLAADGEKATIPETTGSTTGEFSQQYGFQAINALPLQAGGVAPKREDFNGAFNLLGGVAFYAQKGWVFEYDSTQDYYKGCIVTDPADGNKYECIADMVAGTIAPHSDSSGTYWKDANFLIKQITPAYNHRDEITTSGTYTAPVTGWYKITLKGGGAGGQGAGKNSSSIYAGGIGGGEGATEIAYAYMTQGSAVSVTIGAGGSGGNYSSSSLGANGGDGGNTVVTLSSGVTYTANGAVHGGPGADGLIPGGASSPRIFFTSTIPGGTGGGAGGGTGTVTASYVSGLSGKKGGGGAGGGYEGSSNHWQKGGAGGNGYVWFEYWED